MKLKWFVLVCLLGFAARAQQFAPRYQLVKLSRDVNTHYHEAAPVVSQDGKKLYFFVHNHPENSYGKEGSDDIWLSILTDKGEWGPAQHLGSPFNAHRSNQVFTTLPDGSIFIKGGRRKDTKGFSIVSADGSLSELEIQGFEEMNKGRFYGASISSDARHIILFFSETPTSTRSNLYVSNLQGDGKWSRPVKLNISVKDDDCGPFIDADNQILYFASDRNLPGKKGKLDIYKVKRLDDSWQKWSQPENMGSPINTAAEELYFCIDRQGNVFTSRANSTIDGGNLDLFKLVPRDVKVMLNATVLNKKTSSPIVASVTLATGDKSEKVTTKADGLFQKRVQEMAVYTISTTADNFLPDEQSLAVPVVGNDTTINLDIYLTPIAKKLIVTGTVYDKKTEQPVMARVEVQQRNKRNVNYKVGTNEGKYAQELPGLGWYLLTASAEGYLNSTDSVQADSEDNTPLFKDLFLAPIEVGLTVRLKNIYFDFDKTTLKKESFVELNKVVDFLKQNPTVEIEISGHTDSKGSDDYNLNLSQGRSQSVVDYIVSQGIDSFRLTAHGYGETKPIDTNDSDAGRANNRRVEFTVVKK
jgi:outer membrane protein OmpA-like peptidoglycan-associated protein